MNKCIYKETEDLRFRKAEHVIPAGLGGKTTLPKGYVSDKVNEMFSAIEAKALRTSIIGGVRNFVGPGHRGKMTVSKKLKPHMNILKLNAEFSTGVESVLKYKMGFMLDRKTKFIPQILFKVSQNLEIEQVVYSPGEFNNEYNSLNKFVVAVNNIKYKNVIPIQTEHNVEFSGTILGNFYGEWYMYSNVPFITTENLIKIIQEQKWSEKIQINLSSGGKYDFSYRLSGGIKDGSFFFIHVKSAFNVLAYRMGQNYVLDSRFDRIRNAIKNNKTEDFMAENDDCKIVEWIKTTGASEPHVVIIKTQGEILYAYVSFYGEMIYKIEMAIGITDKLYFAFVCDWKNKNDYIVDIKE